MKCLACYERGTEKKKSESSTGFEPMTSLMWMGEVPTGLSKYYFETLSDLTAQRNYLSQG